jgi:hypothetical protein
MQPRSRVLLFIALAALTTLLCFRQSTAHATTPPAPKTHAVQSTKGYIVNIPDNWIDMSAQAKGMIDKIFARPKKSNKEIFIENTNIVVEPLNHAYSLQEYSNLNIANMKKFMKSLIVVSNSDFAGKVKGKKLVYTWNSPTHSLHFKYCAYIFLNKTSGYVVTCSATQDSYAKYAAQFDAIGHSFRWK